MLFDLLLGYLCVWMLDFRIFHPDAIPDMMHFSIHYCSSFLQEIDNKQTHIQEAFYDLYVLYFYNCQLNNSYLYMIGRL